MADPLSRHARFVDCDVSQLWYINLAVSSSRVPQRHTACGPLSRQLPEYFCAVCWCVVQCAWFAPDCYTAGLQAKLHEKGQEPRAVLSTQLPFAAGIPGAGRSPSLSRAAAGRGTRGCEAEQWGVWMPILGHEKISCDSWIPSLLFAFRKVFKLPHMELPCQSAKRVTILHNLAELFLEGFVETTYSEVSN